jgi:cytochrome c peroxidase
LGFSDGLATHAGVDGGKGIRNVMGLANVAWRSPLTWADATVTHLEQQALVPMTGEHPVEMGLKDADAKVAARLGADDCYVRMFSSAFPESRGRIGLAEVARALAAFQRTLISRDSPADRFRGGEAAALSPLARRGAGQFAANCAECHRGPDLTDDQHHYVGTDASAGSTYGGPALDPTADTVAWFRTPSLRNVAITGPWLHDGSARTIEQAIRSHAPTRLGGADMPALLAFLDAQTDRRFLSDARFAKPATACGRPLS